MLHLRSAYRRWRTTREDGIREKPNRSPEKKLRHHRIILAAVLAFAPIAAAPIAAARAETADCAPLTALPGYAAQGAPETRAYAAMAMKPDETLAGETCTQHYALAEGAVPLDDGHIQDLYRAMLRAAGARIVWQGPHGTAAQIAAQLPGTQPPGTSRTDLWLRIESHLKTIDVTTLRPHARAQVLTAPGPGDYPLLGHMPDYLAESTDRRAFDQRGFTVKDGDDTREVTVQGARYEVDYSLRDGARPASDLDIQENYRTALIRAGARLLFTDEHNTTARIERNGHPVWIRVWSQESAVNISVIEEGPHVPTLLPPSGPDPHLLGHMPGYVAEPPEKHPPEDVIFALPTPAGGDDTRDIKVQGARVDIAYAPAPGATPASDLDIQLNYRGALAKLGAQILFTDPATTIARLNDADRVLWVKVWSQETAINLTLVKEKLFRTDAAPITAETLRDALASRGRATLHPPFLINTATPQPEAQPLIAEVIRLLRETPGLSVTLECHTDDLAPHARSLALSIARADALRATILAAGIDPARVIAQGLGPDHPAADNTTSEGRARNRRVVLVKR